MAQAKKHGRRIPNAWVDSGPALALGVAGSSKMRSLEFFAVNAQLLAWDGATRLGTARETRIGNIVRMTRCPRTSKVWLSQEQQDDFERFHS